MRLRDVETSRCVQCGAPLIVFTEPAGAQHFARAVCSVCGRFRDWIKKPENEIRADVEYDGDGEEWFERDCEQIGETEWAIRVRTDDGPERWIPKSQIRAGCGDHGSVIVTMWWAQKARWDDA